MGTITYYKPNGEWGIEGVDLTALPPKVYGALCKLHDLEHKDYAAAENFARLIGVSVPAERLKELARAEKNGRLVVLPCKVGDLLYEVDVPEYGVITCKVVSVYYRNGSRFHVPGYDVVSVLSVEVDVVEGHGKGKSYDFEMEEFGKTVFLTREEAEAALKKMEA